MLIFTIFLVFSRLLFFCIFQGVIDFLASVEIHDIRIHHPFLPVFSESWLVDTLGWPAGPLQLVLPPWLKLIVTPLVVTPKKLLHKSSQFF